MYNKIDSHALLRPTRYFMFFTFVSLFYLWNKIHTDTVDIWTDYGRFPFDTPVKMYKFLGKHPFLWKLSYDMARFPLTR